MMETDGHMMERCWKGYEGKIPDFSQTTAEQVNEWIEVCNFCCLSYASEFVLNAIQQATEEQITSREWMEEKKCWNMKFWLSAWKFLNRPGMTWKKFKCPDEDTDAFIFCDNDRLTICWRGTESTKDWMNNIKISTTPWPHNKDVKGEVHLGYLEAYNAIRDVVRAECEKMIAERNIKVIEVTGHSMGSALAAICCLDFTTSPLKDPVPMYAIVIGPAPTGNKEFKDYFMSVFPDLEIVTHAVDPLHHTWMDDNYCGNVSYLKVAEGWTIISSHYAGEYLRFAEGTKQYIQDQQIQQQPSTRNNKHRFFNFN